MSEPLTSSGHRRFHLRKRIGAGAFGEVFLAEQDSGAGFTRRVALKLLHGQGRGMREAGRRMRDEARILGRLSHRNIVAVLDLVKIDERWAVVMDYVEGPDLDRLVEALQRTDESVPLAAALEIGAAVADALDAAWRAEDGRGGCLHVVHRDIKPSNVLLTRDGDVKVLDFGVARVELEEREARTGALVGTERYMSPERVLREHDGPAGDVYALGATLVELLLLRPMGRTPVLPDRHAVFVDLAIDELRSTLGAGTPAVDEAIDWIRRCLHAEPEHRPSPREVADALDRLAPLVGGDNLRAFARRFVPKVDDVLGSSAQTVTGTLAENTVSEQSSQSPVAPTMVDLDDPSEAGAEPTPERSPVAETTPMAAPAPPARGRAVLPLLAAALIAIGLGGVGVAGLVAAALLAFGGGDDASPQAAIVESPAIAVEPAAPPAAVAPGPVEPAAAAEAPTGERSEAAPGPATAPAEAVRAPAPAASADTSPGVAKTEPVGDADAAEAEPAVAAASEPEPQPVAEPPVAAQAAVPAPATPDVRGTWSGNAAGRPLTLRVHRTEGASVYATAEVVQGAVVRSLTLSGGFDDSGLLVLTSEAGARFEATLTGSRLEGSWIPQSGAKALRWRVDRQ